MIRVAADPIQGRRRFTRAVTVTCSPGGTSTSAGSSRISALASCSSAAGTIRVQLLPVLLITIPNVPIAPP